MSLPDHNSRPERSRKLTEKGAHQEQMNVWKLMKDAEKTFQEAYEIVKSSDQGRTNEAESSFDNLMEALASVKKAIEKKFDLLALSNIKEAEFIQMMTKTSAWIEEMGAKMDELKRRFNLFPKAPSTIPLWQLAAGRLLEEQNAKAQSIASATSTVRARAEAAAAKKRMELELQKKKLLTIQFQEEAKREAEKKQRDLDLEAMKFQIEYEVAQARLEALEGGSIKAMQETQSVVDHHEEYASDDKKENFEEEWIKKDPYKLVAHPLQDNMKTFREQDLVSIMAETQRALLYGIPKLVQFSGKAEDFYLFMASWMSTAGAPGGNPAYKLQSLLTNLDEKSRNLVSHCSYLNPEAGYERAINILYERYGRVDVLVDAFMEKMKRYPKIQGNDAQALESFANLLDQSVLAFEELSKRPGSSDFVCMASTVRNVAEILVKLPNRLREKFVKITGSNSSSIKRLRDFLKAESREANNPVLRVCKEIETLEKSEKNSSRRNEVSKKSSTGSSFATELMSCFVCGANSHPAYKCKVFAQKSAKDRIAFLKQENRCFNCFADKHRSNDCNLKSFCKKGGCRWQSPHSWLMHDRQEKQQDSGKAKKSQEVKSEESKAEASLAKHAEVVNTCASSGRRAFFQVIPISIRTKTKPNHTITCWAMLDPCSSAHFGCKKLAELLSISGQRRSIILRTMNGSKSQPMKVSDILVSGLENKQEFYLKDVKFQESDDLSLSAVPKAADGQRWPQLQSVIGKVKHDEVLLLIGLEAQDVFQKGHVDGPLLVETGLGKAVQGLVGEGGFQCESANFVEIESNSSLENQVRRFFEVEDCQALYDDTKAMSAEDARAMKMIEESIKKVEGRYEVRVPWRSLPPVMPNNHHQAYHRISCLRKKLLQDPDSLEEYANAISAYEENGFAERVPDKELQAKEGKASWLCHHGVKHERKPLRIVFNASKVCKGKALNTEILQGPDLLSKLVGILLRFRRHPIAVSADIKAFFHQVRVPQEDADFQRYLWFEDSDPKKRIIEMRMRVHLFGGISSQTCSVAALNRCIKDAEARREIDGRFADEAIRSFYCDDFLRSFQDSNEALDFSLRLREVLRCGGFRLVKFISTDKKILKTIPQEDVAQSCIPDDSVKDIFSSALGIHWDVRKDILSFPKMSKPREIKITKRDILGFIASIYDPLGILGPIIATAKMVLSAIFRLGLDWDEPIQSEEGAMFSSWMKTLTALEGFSITRCLIKPTSKVLSAELHLFSDGAEPGYGCCAYAVFVEDSRRTSCFLMSKSKICSKKGKLTTPKVELCGAVLATRLMRVILREVEENFQQIWFWTDSMSTLKMIRNEKTRFKVFEANRLEEIRSCSKTTSWKFVPGKQNPSDLLTRPFKLDESFKSDHFFFRGPPFLGMGQNHWPKEPEGAEDVNVSTVEECHLTDTRKWSIPDDLLPRIGTWLKVKKFTAVMVRLQRCYKGEARKGRLTAEELQEAETYVFVAMQERSFKEEIGLVLAKKPLPKAHSLSKYNPFLKDGLLRVAGRLCEADIDFDLKHPIILPKKGHVTELIVDDIHRRDCHGTPQMVLNGIRQRFHIPDALRLVKKVIGRCLECKRYNQRLGEQIMANLHHERMALQEPPFTHTGCDVAGPFFVKRSRKIQKRYICLFTCMTVRAVHLEVLENLEADTFVNAFRRFLARRGPIKTIRTDNALNFRGGDREIREAIEEWNNSDIGARPQFRNEGVSWKYQTPKASSHSGVWERMIRSMRVHLRHVLKDQDVNEDSFLTLVTEVEAIMNSRPLVPVSEDPDDLAAITPSMLLNMKQTCTPSPGKFDKNDMCVRKRWRHIQACADFFWKRFIKEYVCTLISRQKWVRQRRDFKVGDLVLISDELLPRSHWPMGRISRAYPGKDNRVRSCQVKTRSGFYDRPVNKLALMEAGEL